MGWKKPCAILTGKERDPESGLDYFGARYYWSSAGRFASPDPGPFHQGHIASPQKWNKYAYVQNNPLGRIDPDGLDDYRVFVPDTRARGNWRRAEAAAKANGHTFELFKGERANVDAWITARKNPNARVVYVGHTSHDEKGVNAVVLSDGRSAGNVAVTGEGTENATVINFEPSVQSVGLFACDSIDLARQYPGADFVGVDSGPGNETSLEAMGPAAAAFVAADAVARPADGKPQANAPDPIAAANSALKANKRKEDLDQDRVKRP